jgi:hypothetical protein
VPLQNRIDFSLCGGAVQQQHFSNVPTLITIPRSKVKINKIANYNWNATVGRNVALHDLFV